MRIINYPLAIHVLPRLELVHHLGMCYLFYQHEIVIVILVCLGDNQEDLFPTPKPLSISIKCLS